MRESILRDWPWFAVPFLLVCAAVAWLAATAPPSGPFTFDPSAEEGECR